MNRIDGTVWMVGLTALLVAGLDAPASGSVMEVTGITTTPATTSATDTDDPVVLDAVTVGSTTYSVIELPTSVSLTPDVIRYWAINGADPGSDNAALTDGNLDTGVFNPDSGLVQWGRTIALDEVIVYMDLDRSPFGRFDGITISAIDAGDNVIGDYSLTIPDDTDPTFLYEQNVRREDGETRTDGFNNIGYTFSLSDLTGTTGDLSLATGIRFENASSGNSGDSDPTLIAIIAVPEPTTMMLLAAGGATMWRRRRAQA